jgi:GGDEF domain-containing protein
MFSVSQRISHHSGQEAFQHLSRVLVDVERDSLHSASSGQSSNRWLRDSAQSRSSSLSGVPLRGDFADAFAHAFADAFASFSCHFFFWFFFLFGFLDFAEFLNDLFFYLCSDWLFCFVFFMFWVCGFLFFVLVRSEYVFGLCEIFFSRDFF